MERDAAADVKQKQPDPRDSGQPALQRLRRLAVDEERDLSRPIDRSTRSPAPQGQGLNDLYVRFFRMAERRITEGTAGRGHRLLHQQLLLARRPVVYRHARALPERFDDIWIDCLNGDKYKTGKLTPEGEPDPACSPPSTTARASRVGTAIALLVRSADHEPVDAVEFRHFWGQDEAG